MINKRSCKHWYLSQLLVMKHIYRWCYLYTSHQMSKMIVNRSGLSTLQTIAITIKQLSIRLCQIKLIMNHDGLEQNVQPTDLAEILSYTSQSLVISYSKEWLKWVEVKGLLIWRDIVKSYIIDVQWMMLLALMCGTVLGFYGSRDLKPKQLVIWICKAVFNCS